MYIAKIKCTIFVHVHLSRLKDCLTNIASTGKIITANTIMTIGKQ